MTTEHSSCFHEHRFLGNLFPYTTWDLRLVKVCFENLIENQGSLVKSISKAESLYPRDCQVLKTTFNEHIQQTDAAGHECSIKP